MMNAASRSAMPLRMPSGITSSTNTPTRISVTAIPWELNTCIACFTAPLKFRILSSALAGKNKTTSP